MFETQTPGLSQSELLSDLLSTEKQLIKDYANYVTESSCANLRQLLIGNMIECSTDQLGVFREMKSRNLYQTKDAPEQDVQNAKSKMQQLRQQTGI